MKVNINPSNMAASICRDEYYSFVREMWTTIVKETPVWNWHIKYLCDELQECAERVFRGEPKKHDLIINVPPGSTKSLTCTVFFIPWVWTRMMSAKSINASHTESLALDLSRKSRDVVMSDKYLEYFPEFGIRPDQNTKGYYANTGGGFRYSVGVGGSVIGMHGHFLGIDDPIDPESAFSEVDVGSTNRWCSQTLPSRKVDKEVAVTFLIMQRLAQDDPTGHLLSKGKENVKHICLPSELADNVKPVELRDRYVDGLLDPIRLSPRVLKEAQVDLGEYGYSGQHRQNPVPPGGGMFKTDMIEIKPQLPTKAFKSIIRYWDKAGSHKAGAFTVGFKLGLYEDLLGPKYQILGIERGQWGTAEREKRIQDTAEWDGRTVIVGLEREPADSGKESAEATARRLHGYRVRIDLPSGDKTLRADPVSTAVNMGLVSISQEVPERVRHAFYEEAKHFPASTFKDQIDAFSGAYKLIRQRRVVGAITD